MGEAKKSGEPGWTWRKAVVIPVIIFALWRLVALQDSPDTTLNGTLAWIWGWIVIGGMLFFTGFATIQDIIAILATKSGLPYNPQSSPAEPTPGTEAVRAG